ncbi:MAG: hypothetical protein HYX99_02115 [Chloroflexi bacterium]|nr:hypothetical protein [Chloroflexota bacterium]
MLRAGKFKGPDQQFQKAIRALNVRPQPDTENCIKDAVGALEGVARIVTGDEKSTLGDLLDKKLVPTIIPKPLHKAFEAVYGYRSTTPGIGHGQVEASTVMLEDAELVLGLCAAMIIYLAKKK